MKCITIVVIAVLISYTWDTLSGCRMSSCTHFSWLKKNKLKFFKNKNNKKCGVVSQSSSSNSEWASWSGSLQFIFSIEREKEKILYGFCISILYAMFCFFFILRKKISSAHVSSWCKINTFWLVCDDEAWRLPLRALTNVRRCQE